MLLIVTAQLLNAALPYWNPCLVRDPSDTPPSLPHPTHNSYVITLFADATIIPFTLSADATITSWTPIKITSIKSVHLCEKILLMKLIFFLVDQ